MPEGSRCRPLRIRDGLFLCSRDVRFERADLVRSGKCYESNLQCRAVPARQEVSGAHAAWLCTTFWLFLHEPFRNPAQPPCKDRGDGLGVRTIDVLQAKFDDTTSTIGRRGVPVPHALRDESLNMTRTVYVVHTFLPARSIIHEINRVFRTVDSCSEDPAVRLSLGTHLAF